LPRFRAPDPLPQIPEDAFLEDLPAVADIGKVLRSTAEDERKVEKEREEDAFLEDLPAVADIGKVLRWTAEDERKVEKEREEAAKWPWERDEEDEEEEE